MNTYQREHTASEKPTGLLAALRKANAELLANPAHEQLYNAAEAHFAASRKNIDEIREKLKHAGRTGIRQKP